MRVTPKSRLRVRLENMLFVALFLAVVGLLAWLSTRYNFQADWTAAGRNTLSVASQTLLDRLEGPIQITAYARENPVLRSHIKELVERYRRHKPDMAISFINPDTVPDQVRELGVTVDGELIVSYRGRSDHVQFPTEQSLTNALQRVARAGERRLVFLTGHGERAPLGQANHDLGDFGRQLQQRGVRVERVNLADRGSLPEGTTVLVIAGPQVNLRRSEVKILEDYVEQGGNLLWLAEPGSLRGLGPVAEQLSLEVQPGVVVDPRVENTAAAIITFYSPHPATQDFDLDTLFPSAAAMEADPPAPWESKAILTTAGHAWSETGELAGEVVFEADSDIRGPLDIGIALTRPLSSGEVDEATGRPDPNGPERLTQRVVVIGDGDFLSNRFLGNGGNLDLGLNLINWLASDDALIAIPARIATDRNLTLSLVEQAMIGFGFLLGMPLLLMGSGLVIWLRRRKR